MVITAAAERDASRADCAIAIADADVALVAHFISAFNLRDLDAMLARLHRDVEFHPLRLIEVGNRYAGHTGVREWFAELVVLDLHHRVVISALQASSSGLVIASGRLEIGNDTMPTMFCGVYRLTDRLIIAGHHYMSDLETLTQVGILTP